MQISGELQAINLRMAAEEIGVAIEIDTLNAKGNRMRVKLYPGTPPPEAFTKGGNRRKGEAGDAKYQRTSASGFRSDRRVNAVCWHGFRDFFRAVFELDPNAVCRTALATWKGSEHFEANYQESGHTNIGSEFYPMRHVDACRCPDQGQAN